MTSTKIETGHKDVIHDAAIDYYGKRLATTSSDSAVRVVSIADPTNSMELKGHQGPVWRVAWAHPKYGTFIASCGYDGKVIIWKEEHANHWVQFQVYSGHKSSVNSIAWAPYELGLSLACGSSDGTISVISLREGGWEAATIERAHPVGVTAVSWAPATSVGSFLNSGDLVQKIVSGGFDAVVKVWVFLNGSWRLESSLVSELHKDCVRDVAWAPALGLAKSTIASSSQDGNVVMWTKAKEGDMWEGKLLNHFEYTVEFGDKKEKKTVAAPVWRVSWSLTGNILAVSAGDKDTTLWKEGSDGQWQEVTKVAP